MDRILDGAMILALLLGIWFGFIQVNERIMFFFLFIWEGIIMIQGNHWYLKKVKKLLQRRIRLIKKSINKG